jgi:hypothetical protein
MQLFHPTPGAAMPPVAARRFDTARAAEYRQMQRGFQATGGLTDSQGLMRWGWRESEQPISRLARGIVDRELVHVEWQGCLWLPLFQFQLPLLAVRPAVRDAMAELRGDFDDWDLALGFATPHALLGGRSPAADALDGHRELVHVARADRFLLRG